MDGQRMTPDELAEAVRRGAAPKPCSVYRFLNDPANEDYFQSLETLLFTNELSLAKARELLGKMGLPIGEPNLARHRKGDCLQCEVDATQ